MDNFYRPNAKNEPEFVVCAAIWLLTGKKEERCNYITPGSTSWKDNSGLVFTGLSHADVLQIMVKYLPKETLPLTRKNSVQGFVTSKRRFVDRTEGFKIAYNSGQIKINVDIDKLEDYKLFSEHLY